MEDSWNEPHRVTDVAAARAKSQTSKVSFSVAKTSTRPALLTKSDPPNEESEVKFVTEFDVGGETCTDGSFKVIPVRENSWRPEKRMKNIMVASGNLVSTELRFESEALSAGPQPSVQYGLQLKTKPPNDADELLNREGKTLHAHGPWTMYDRELKKLRENVEALPEETSQESYTNVPVEQFGEALLRGMGWEKNKPIGRNAKIEVVPYEPVRRVGKEGLGAIPAPRRGKVQKVIKPGETRKSMLIIGRIMCIISGKYTGCRGQIAEVNGNSYTLALLEGGKRVVVSRDGLAEVGSLAEEEALKKLSDLGLVKNEGTGKLSECNADRQQKSKSRKRDVMDEEHKHSRESVGEGGYQKREMVLDTGALENLGSSRIRNQDDDRCNGGHGDNREKGREKGDAEKYEHEKWRRDDRDKNREIEKSRRERKNMNFDDENQNEATDRDGLVKGRYVASNSKHEKISGRKEVRHDKKGVDNRREDSEGSFSVEKVGRTKREDRKKSIGGKKDSREDATVITRNGKSWLARDIRVRIIEKKIYGEKRYLQKARVVDVVTPSVCDIQMNEDGEIIQKVKQEHLETALPKRGGPVLVVDGEYRGQLGKLEERFLDEGIGLVQMEDTYEVLSFDLDNLAEYVGGYNEMED